MKLSLQALVAAICLLVPGITQAQTPAEGTIDLFGTLGYARFDSGSTNWSSGLETGGGAEFLPFTGRMRPLGIVGGISFVDSSTTEFGGSTQQVDARQFTVAATWHFSLGPTQPYVLGGVAVLSAERTWWCDGCSHGPAAKSTGVVEHELIERVNDQSVGYLIGGGVKFVPGKRFSYRVESSFADTTPVSGWNWSLFGVRGAVGIRF